MSLSTKTLNTRVIQKHDAEANWKKATSFIPKKGEIIIYDSEVSHGTGDITELPSGRTEPFSQARIKIGDGITTVSNLPFVSGVLMEQEGTDSIPFVAMAHLSDGREVDY